MRLLLLRGEGAQTLLYSYLPTILKNKETGNLNRSITTQVDIPIPMYMYNIYIFIMNLFINNYLIVCSIKSNVSFGVIFLCVLYPAISFLLVLITHIVFLNPLPFLHDNTYLGRLVR